MKSLADLEAIRAKTLENINMRKDENAARVVIGMATCGIAAGARPVMLAFMEEIQKRNLQHVTVHRQVPLRAHAGRDPGRAGKGYLHQLET